MMLIFVRFLLSSPSPPLTFRQIRSCELSWPWQDHQCWATVSHCWLVGPGGIRDVSRARHRPCLGWIQDEEEQSLELPCRSRQSPPAQESRGRGWLCLEKSNLKLCATKCNWKYKKTSTSSRDAFQSNLLRKKMRWNFVTESPGKIV